MLLLKNKTYVGTELIITFNTILKKRSSIKSVYKFNFPFSISFQENEKNKIRSLTFQ